MNAQKYSIFILILALCFGVAAVLGWRKASTLGQENQALRQELADAQAQVNQAKAAAQDGAAAYRSENQAQRNEIMRLRGEITQLRAGGQAGVNLEAENQRLRGELQQLRAAAAAAGAVPPALPDATPPPQPGQHLEFLRDNWVFAGYGTPEAALMSAIWAMKEGEPGTYLESLSPEEQARVAQLWQNQTEDQIAAKHQQDVAPITGIRVLDRQTGAQGEIIMTVTLDGANRTEQVRMRQVGNEWKFGGFVR